MADSNGNGNGNGNWKVQIAKGLSAGGPPAIILAYVVYLIGNYFIAGQDKILQAVHDMTVEIKLMRLQVSADKFDQVEASREAVTEEIKARHFQQTP